MKKQKRILGLETCDQELDRLPTVMSLQEKERVIEAIEGFIGETGDPYDWDWMINNPKRSKEGTVIGYFCNSLDIIYPPEKEGHFCGSDGMQKLSELFHLIKSEDPGSPRVLQFLEDHRRKAEQVAAGNVRYRVHPLRFDVSRNWGSTIYTKNTGLGVWEEQT